MCLLYDMISLLIIISISLQIQPTCFSCFLCDIDYWSLSFMCGDLMFVCCPCTSLLVVTLLLLLPGCLVLACSLVIHFYLVYSLFKTKDFYFILLNILTTHIVS